MGCYLENKKGWNVQLELSGDIDVFLCVEMLISGHISVSEDIVGSLEA